MAIKSQLIRPKIILLYQPEADTTKNIKVSWKLFYDIEIVMRISSIRQIGLALGLVFDLNHLFNSVFNIPISLTQSLWKDVYGCYVRFKWE